MKTLFVFSLAVACITTRAQNIVIKDVELMGEKIIVSYDLEDSNPQNEYRLELYASKDNFASPLAKVKGDIGLEIKPGANKKIEWTVREDIGDYKGLISLEVRGKVYVPFVKLQSFNTNESYKRGKSYTVSMKAGNTNAIHVELYKGGQRISGEMNHPNNGSYTLSIPSNAKPGKDYRIKITDSKNSEDLIYSPVFKVKPKFPLVLKVIPVLAIGGLIAILGGGGEDKTTTTTTETNIPLPSPPGG